jgi:hypothetical protein
MMRSVLCCLLCLGACVVDEIPREAVDDTGEVEQDITQGNLIPTDHQWAVRLEIDNGPGVGNSQCSGVVMTAHYVLTAAHCVYESIVAFGTYEDNRIQIREQAWDATLTTPVVFPASGSGFGGARFYRHSSWVPGIDTASNAAYDIAVIKLDDDGIASAQRARFWSDARNPWDNYSTVTIAGFGRGSYGYLPDCEGTDPFEHKGLMGYFSWAGTKVTQYAQATSNQSTPCLGDSGGPWWVQRGSYDLVTSVHSSSDEVINGLSTGSLIKPKWQWILDKAVQAGLPLSCTESTSSGYYFKRCTD